MGVSCKIDPVSEGVFGFGVFYSWIIRNNLMMRCEQWELLMTSGKRWVTLRCTAAPDVTDLRASSRCTRAGRNMPDWCATTAAASDETGFRISGNGSTRAGRNVPVQVKVLPGRVKWNG
ncbi:unnamed protein product [Anisakis simplex]|uniref:Acyl-CoA thioesterase n=1 Tax=Anisakis simplex TaxID=6269 RepID=A0A0M3J3L7_ANISI|nr:unnamed protein product [Anisakis simplex]